MSSSTGYGPKLDPIALQKVLDHVMARNAQIAKAGHLGTPLCVWGSHGLGKTQMVQEYARSKGWKFTYCAPAQFEEMGDLHGIPSMHDPTPDRPNSGDEVTIFAPPEWVPKEKGPGILLLDDINRADDRILRGTMQKMADNQPWTLPATIEDPVVLEEIEDGLKMAGFAAKS